MKIAIIEDEKRTAKDLARTIAAIDPKAEIVVMLQSVEEALEYFAQPVELDLIFSDIQLGDGLSFEIFEQANLHIPIIYCTAFNHYALEAFKTLGIDYLVKPFSKSTVSVALEKYNTIKDAFRPQQQESLSDLMIVLKSQLQPAKKPSVIIHQKDKIIPLSIEKIALFFIENDMVYAHTFTGERHPVSHKLNDLEEKYAPEFFRANRQFLINRKAVKDASHYFNRKVMVHLHIPFEEQILVGKVKVTAFLEWLAGG
ncbi:MAG: LytTR family DNA-binding domain-containing protein [Bacteroidota bacterium]